MLGRCGPKWVEGRNEKGRITALGLRFENDQLKGPRHIATHYEWYVLERDKGGREKKRKLRWRMTPGDAAAWAAANPGKPLEMVPNSGEERHETGPYVGWGQVLRLEPDRRR